MTGPGQDGPAAAADPDVPPGMPLWVKVAAVVVALLLVLFLVLQLTGLGGHHGPGRHTPSGLPAIPAGTAELPANG